jgi:hypothetical protein
MLQTTRMVAVPLQMIEGGSEDGTTGTTPAPVVDPTPISPPPPPPPPPDDDASIREIT